MKILTIALPLMGLFVAGHARAGKVFYTCPSQNQFTLTSTTPGQTPRLIKDPNDPQKPPRIVKDATKDWIYRVNSSASPSTLATSVSSFSFTTLDTVVSPKFTPYSIQVRVEENDLYINCVYTLSGSSKTPDFWFRVPFSKMKSPTSYRTFSKMESRDSERINGTTLEVELKDEAGPAEK